MSETLNPFLSDGTWLRCGPHAHTTNSDGELAPDKLAGHYERAGYDVPAITDHGFRTDEASTDELLVIPSAELNAQSDGPGEHVHVPALGITTDPVTPRGAPVNAGRLGYPHQGRALEWTDDGLITAVELRRPRGAPYGRVEVADAAGGRAWTNPLWI